MRQRFLSVLSLGTWSMCTRAQAHAHEQRSENACPRESKSDFQAYNIVTRRAYAPVTMPQLSPSLSFSLVGCLSLPLSFSLSLRLGNSACPSTLCPPPPPPSLFSRLFFSFSPSPTLDHAPPLLAALSGPAHRFRSAPAILERVSPTSSPYLTFTTLFRERACSRVRSMHAATIPLFWMIFSKLCRNIFNVDQVIIYWKVFE